MNTETGQIYHGQEEIASAFARYEKLIELDRQEAEVLAAMPPKQRLEELRRSRAANTAELRKLGGR